MRSLIIIMAAVETAVGLALIACPSQVAWLLVGSGLDSPVAFTVARVTGVALLALGVACWRVRDHAHSHAISGILSGMLVYNAGVCAVLVYAALGEKLFSLALWPTAIFHAGLAAWCLGCLMRKSTEG